jgi:hydrogenase maturation protease
MSPLDANLSGDWAGSTPDRREATRSPSGQPRVLVIGYGNPGRQDDGLGPAASAQIEALGWPHVTAHENYQLNIEDALDVADHDVVWFVDAARSGPSPFSIETLAPDASLEFTSHMVRPEAILAMAHQYYGAKPLAFLLGIRGYEFEFVEALTPAAAENLRQAVAMLKIRLGAAQPKAAS